MCTIFGPWALSGRPGPGISYGLAPVLAALFLSETPYTIILFLISYCASAFEISYLNIPRKISINGGQLTNALKDMRIKWRKQHDQKCENYINVEAIYCTFLISVYNIITVL
jgi:hypothetical protein